MEGARRPAVRSAMARLPANVLLVGARWDSLAQALGSLKASAAVRLHGPVAASAAASFRPAPSIILLAPDFTREDWAASKREQPRGPRPPLTLQCLTSHELEVGTLYQYADDFVVTPCPASELEMRVLRLAARLESPEGAEALRVGHVVLDTAKYQVTVGAATVDLAWLEFKLLRLLMERPGIIFSREQLLAQVWGTEHFGGTRTVDVHIRRLRAKLGDEGEKLLRTVRNVGYGVAAP